VDLSPEDTLRLNVLLASRPQAVRIDESRMTVHALSPEGEARVALNANCRDDLYLRRVRELISGRVLGSPGGYPVFLRRWTRMGQARSDSLEQLLLLAEPEAVVAVVHAGGLTDELARRAWWAMPTAENARRMLEREVVARGRMGPVLAEFLVEHLPFEEEARDQVDSVRLVLQPGLIGESTRLALWAKGRQKNAYHVGFLLATPDGLPEREPGRPDLATWAPGLEPLAARGNPWAAQLLRVLDGPGQSFLGAVAAVLRRPGNQDVVNALLDAVARYFAPVCPDGDPEADLEHIVGEVAALLDGRDGSAGSAEGLRAVLAAVPALRSELRAILVLSRVGYPVVRPVFSRTTAGGSLMRQRLEPVTRPLLREIASLRSAAGPQS
jgi:hypothetical protein